jgi:hypothetical protein
MATSYNTNVINFNKIMEYLKMPKEYYKVDYYDNKHGMSISDWLKLYRTPLKHAPVKKVAFKFDIHFKNKNHLPDELFEI